MKHIYFIFIKLLPFPQQMERSHTPLTFSSVSDNLVFLSKIFSTNFILIFLKLRFKFDLHSDSSFFTMLIY